MEPTRDNHRKAKSEMRQLRPETETVHHRTQPQRPKVDRASKVPFSALECLGTEPETRVANSTGKARYIKQKHARTMSMPFLTGCVFQVAGAARMLSAPLKSQPG